MFAPKVFDQMPIPYLNGLNSIVRKDQAVSIQSSDEIKKNMTRQRQSFMFSNHNLGPGRRNSSLHDPEYAEGVRRHSSEGSICVLSKFISSFKFYKFVWKFVNLVIKLINLI